MALTFLVTTKKHKLEYAVYYNYNLVIRTTNRRLALNEYKKIKDSQDKN